MKADVAKNESPDVAFPMAARAVT